MYYLSVNSSHLLLTLHEVPKLRLSEDWIGSENSNPEERRVWYLLRWVLSPDDDILPHLGPIKDLRLTLFCIVLTPTPLTISLLLIMK